MLFPPPPPPSKHLQYTNYPLKNIPHPHPHDVLCGRGGGTNAHIGNSHWRMLVSTNKELYVTLPKRQKMLLSKSIVNAVRSQHPPGRFLQKDPQTELWYDVGDQRAQEKTSQALREGAPDIRSKLKPTGQAATANAVATSATTRAVRRRKLGSTDGGRGGAGRGGGDDDDDDETISPKSAATSVASSVSPPLPLLSSMPPSWATPTTTTALDGNRSGGTDTDEPMLMYSAAPAPGGMASPVPMMPTTMILNQNGQPVPSVISQVSSSAPSSQQQQQPVSLSSSSSAVLPLPYPSGGLPASLLVPPSSSSSPPVVVGTVMPSLPQPIPPQGPVPEKNRRKKNSSSSLVAGAATTRTTTSNSAPSSQTSMSTTSTTLTQTTGNPATTTALDNDTDGGESGSGSGAAVAPPPATPPPDPIPSANDENNNDDNDDVIAMADRIGNNDRPKPTKEEEDVAAVVVEDVEPPAGLDPEAQFSFGSIALTDMEQAKLMNGFSIGSAMSYIHQADQQRQNNLQNNERQSGPEPPPQRSEASPKREDSSHAALFHNGHHHDHHHYPQHGPYHIDTPPALGTYQHEDRYPSKQQYQQYQQQQYDTPSPSQHYPLHHHQQQPPPQHPYDHHHHSSKRYPQPEPQYHQNHQPNESQTAYVEHQQAENQYHQQMHGPPVFDDHPQQSPAQTYHPYGPQYPPPMQHGAGPWYHNQHDNNYYNYTATSDLCDRGTTAVSTSDCRGPFSESMRRTPAAKEMMPPPPPPPPSGVPASVQYPPQQKQDRQQQEQQSYHQNRHHHHHDVPYPPSHVTPVDGGLEPAGLSFGSVMSIGTADPMKLEPAGLSFGSTMSYSVAKGGPGSGGDMGGGSGSGVPDAVDGGLEAIGTSFGSLSLNTNDPKLLDTFREDQPNIHNQYQPFNHQQLHEQQLHQQQETAAVQAAPTFLRAQKSRGSLLECSDTDSDDEEKSAQISYQKSVEWEKLKAALAQQPSQPQPPFGSIRSVGGSTTRDTAFAAMPPPATHRPATLNIPSTTFDRDFSQMSAISVGGDFGGGMDDNYTPYSLGHDYFYQPQVMPPVRKTALHESDSSGGCNEMPPPPPAMKKHDSGEW